MPVPLSHSSFWCAPGFWLLFILLFASRLAWAQSVTLHLSNGDRITGNIVTESAHQVVLSTAFAGNITIAAEQIQRRETISAAPAPATPPVPLPTPAPASKAAPASQAGGAAKKDKPPKPAVLPVGLANLPDQKPEPQSDFRKFLSEWHGELELGMNLGFSTTDRQTYSGRFRAIHTHPTRNKRTLRNTLDYIFTYGKTDGALVDNRMDGSWKIENDVSKRFLIYNSAGAGYDEVRKIDLQYDVGPGVGYKWLSLTNYVLKTEIGANYQEQFFSDGLNKNRYSLRLAEESWWQISKKLRIDEKIEFFPQIDRLSEYRLRIEGNLSYLLLDNLTFKLTVIDLYETAPARNVSNNDLQIRSSIGIKF